MAHVCPVRLPPRRRRRAGPCVSACSHHRYERQASCRARCLRIGGVTVPVMIVLVVFILLASAAMFALDSYINYYDCLEDYNSVQQTRSPCSRRGERKAAVACGKSIRSLRTPVVTTFIASGVAGSAHAFPMLARSARSITRVHVAWQGNDYKYCRVDPNVEKTWHGSWCIPPRCGPPACGR